MNIKSKIAFCAIAGSQTCRSLSAAALLLFALTFGRSLVAQQPQPRTTLKIVCRYSGPDLPPPLAQPVTIYRASDKYERIEFSPDPARKTRELQITSEPDSWSINLADRTAVHTLDKGPQFNVQHYVLWSQNSARPPDPPFQDLEFGTEAVFARQAGVKDIGIRKIDSKDAKAYLAKTGDREVTLFFDPVTDKPLRIETTKGGKLEMSLEYLEYTDLPFDPKLFALPEGIKVTEGK